jgi:hypothetical protein
MQNKAKKLNIHLLTNLNHLNIKDCHKILKNLIIHNCLFLTLAISLDGALAY